MAFISYNLRSRIGMGGKLDVNQVLESHPMYYKYLPRWTMLADSYAGGMEYEQGHYLEQYYYETIEEYHKRLKAVSLDNHVKSVAGIYNSFLYRRPIIRNLESLDQMMLKAFMEDADLDGRSFDSVMREISIQSMIYGHVWVVMDKPSTQVGTRAEELEQNIRPYISIYTPENVLDWNYSRMPNGKYELDYFKVKEAPNKGEQFVREFMTDETNVFRYAGMEDSDDVDLISTTPNQLGKIPALVVYSNRGPHRGIGLSPLGDIADAQKQLYDMTSEIQQLIQLTNHPSLCKTPDVEAAAGAGGIIQMPSTLDPQLKPYLLQPSGQNIESILNSKAQIIESIDRQACLGGIRSVESRRLSGIGLQTEFQMLNAKLSDFAQNLEHAEEQIFRMFALLNDSVFEGDIQYPRSFSIQDKANDIAMFKLAKEAKIMNPKINDYIDEKILQTLTMDDDEFEEIIDKGVMEHPTTTPEGRRAHIMDMIEEGLSDREMLALHPEIMQSDIDMTRGMDATPEQQSTMSREITIDGFNTQFHYMCPSAVRFANKMTREGRTGPMLLEIVQKSDRVFEIEAAVESTRTSTQQQIQEATQLVDDIKSIATEMLGEPTLVGYMDLHLDAIINPELAGSLKFNGEA